MENKEKNRISIRLRRVFSVSPTQIYKAYNDYAERIISSSPFKRTTTTGLSLMGAAISLSLASSVSAVTPFLLKISFSDGMSITMMVVGGFLFGLGSAGEAYIQLANLRNLSKQSEAATSEVMARKEQIIDRMLSSYSGNGADPKQLPKE
ncbi:hypothetical protein [Methylobacterium sp. Leaf99]|uniref:hypothetical protein n=1 Tax=Methylobacterium sp. Leaf99 TaxID=1736251 RepID=UPI0012EDE2E0|nr:hypothetical protein [Methylobacterium sp. Leaf99]